MNRDILVLLNFKNINKTLMNNNQLIVGSETNNNLILMNFLELWPLILLIR